MNECGSCTLCCRLQAVPELNKAADEPCKFDAGGGCAIYSSRPQSCRDFNCLWLQTRQRVMPVTMPSAARPDRCGVVVTAHEGYAVLHVDPERPDADTLPPIQPLTSKWLRMGVRVLSRCGEARHEIRLKG